MNTHYLWSLLTSAIREAVATPTPGAVTRLRANLDALVCELDHRVGSFSRITDAIRDLMLRPHSSARVACLREELASVNLRFDWRLRDLMERVQSDLAVGSWAPVGVKLSVRARGSYVHVAGHDLIVVTG
ncbi:MAG TPA: hypothetical protein VHE61_14640 [Opitutaceae bacterium]|nr:hypothetical protein [Opitutaceae bacterium]